MSKQFLCVKEGEHFGKLLNKGTLPEGWFRSEDGYTVKLKPDEIISMDSSQFQVGTRVKVVRKIPSCFKHGMLDKGDWNNSWNNTWVGRMDDVLGQEGVITRFNNNNQGVDIDFQNPNVDPVGLAYPLAALQIITPIAFSTINQSQLTKLI